MSLCVAVVTLLAVAFANLASSEEGMGLCYRCPLHHSDGNEGSPFAWVKSFLQEIKRRCPDLETRLRAYTTPRSTTDPKSATTDTKRTSTNQQTSSNNPPATTTDLTSTMVEPPTTINNPSAKTTESPTSTTEPPNSTTDPPTTTTDPQTTTTDPQTTTTDPPTTTTESPTTTTDSPTTTTDPQTTTTDPQTTTTDPPTTTTESPTTTMKSPTTTTDPQTTTSKPGHPDCQALFDAGHTQSAVYNITPAQNPDGLEVYCNMTTDSKGWIVFQRRLNGTVNFTRSWAEYRDGFGDKEGEFWVGNEILRRLTEPVGGEQGWEMRVDLIQEPDIQRSWLYADFHVDAENYTLRVGAFTGLTNVEDALSTAPEPPSNGQPFSTYDRDNDAEPSLNCADELKGGWWFNRCTVTRDDSYEDDAGPHSNLNGEYSQTSDPWVYGRGIVWGFIDKRITRSEMKMRRVP